MLTFVDTPIPAPLPHPSRRHLSAPFGLGEAVLPESVEAARRLASPESLVVTTGQQPGLFLGPLFTLHKALTARALARRLEAAWNRPVVPVFWIAGDDHDFAEASRVSWLGMDGTAVSAALPARADDAPLVPMYREPVPLAVEPLLDQLLGTTAPGDERETTLAWLRRHYRADRSMAGAFGGALSELLAPLGVVCIDGSHPALKRVVWPVARSALQQAAELDRLLVDRHHQLVGQGGDPGVRVGDGATLVMLEGRLGRDRLLAEEGGFTTRRSGERFSLAELDRIAETEPERLSANVLLRPVVESAALPTVAYVAGPGELRYLQLAAALYDPLGVPRQLPLPRWSGLLVEPRVARALEKLQLAISDVQDDGAGLEERVARDLAPPGLEPAVLALRDAIERGFDVLTAEIQSLDPTLERPARSTMAQTLNGLAGLEKKALQAVKRRQTEALAQLQRAQQALRPGGVPQERGLGAVGFLARYGAGWLPELADHIEGWLGSALEGPRPSP